MNPNHTEKATIGGGCFWCLEPIFADLVRVDSVVPGYAGGSDPNPSYKAVCSGTTGHAEVVQKGTTIKRVPSDHVEALFIHHNANDVQFTILAVIIRNPLTRRDER